MFKYLLIFLVFQTVSANPIDEVPIIFEHAQQLESPWLVFINVSSLICGGSLIKKRYIVTAAHCFDDIKPEDLDNEEKLKELVHIKLGEWKTDMDPDCEEGVDEQSCDPVVMIRAKKITLHEDYKASKIYEMYKDDIAIIELAWPPRKTTLVSSVELPKSDECDESVEDQIWTVTAFGQTPERDFTTIKKKIQMKMISHEECADKMVDSEQYYHKESHVCGLGTRGESTCIGDSGSGATKQSNNRHILQGIVSFGVSECGTRDAASGFIKVACYADWIKETIKTELKSSDEDESKEDGNKSKEDGNKSKEDGNKSKEDGNKSNEKDNNNNNRNDNGNGNNSNSDDDENDSWINERPSKTEKVLPRSRTYLQHVRAPQRD